MFKKMKLAQKLAVVIGTVLTVILIVLIAIAITLSKSAIATAKMCIRDRGYRGYGERYLLS